MGKNADGTYFVEMNHPMHKGRHDFKLGESFEADTPIGKRQVLNTVSDFWFKKKASHSKLSGYRITE